MKTLIKSLLFLAIIKKGVIAKPTKKIDAIWGIFFIKPGLWIALVYNGFEMPEQ
jgi:hypothetical protein